MFESSSPPLCFLKATLGQTLSVRLSKSLPGGSAFNLSFTAPLTRQNKCRLFTKKKSGHLIGWALPQQTNRALEPSTPGADNLSNNQVGQTIKNESINCRCRSNDLFNAKLSHIHGDKIGVESRKHPGQNGVEK